ncbi:MAG: hypothetical protein LBU04_02195 [Christensenellaceae bacterium]|jgi:uncharacterized membrane protein|nr:hypothetical protein [Christensenellaceae bacterium]
MDNRVNSGMYNASSQIPDVQQPGRWVPVDVSTLGFKLAGEPNQVVKGPDGELYRIGGPPQDMYGSGIPASAMNAIPTPSTIMQMPPIVQPIALVPYTTQNQPLLQYDPYSRPEEPKVIAASPTYVKKSYRVVSLIGLIFSIIGIALILLLSVASFAESSISDAIELRGLDAIMSEMTTLGFSENPSTYSEILTTYGESLSFYQKVLFNAVPILAIIISVLFLLLIFKFLIKIASQKTPRCFSLFAFLNVILSLALVVVLYLLNGEVTAETTVITDFLTMKSTVTFGIGLIVSLVISLILLIVPLFAKKNAYKLESAGESSQSYIVR